MATAGVTSLTQQHSRYCCTIELDTNHNSTFKRNLWCTVLPIVAALKLTFSNPQPGRATVTVMTRTTMLVVLGTEETVADPITTNTARYASAATVRLQPNPMNVHLTSKVLARPQNFKETAFVTTGT